MKHIVFAVIALVGSVIVACAATDIQPRTNDPANSRAPSAPLPDIGASLAADFDPLHRDVSTSGHRETPTQTPPATHQHEHDHGVAPGQKSSTHEHAASESPGEVTSDEPTASAPTTRAHSGENTGEGPSKSVQKFTCPMHPEIIRNEPGNCPICGMKLVPLDKKDGAKAE